MNNFSRVNTYTNAEIKVRAKNARAFFGVDNHVYVDVIKCLESGFVTTSQGKKRLDFRVRNDDVLQSNDGITSHFDDHVLIAIKRSVYEAAKFGAGRARFSLGHELGHAVLHSGKDMPRSSATLVKPGWLESYKSAEHHANYFASAFLADERFVFLMKSVKEISLGFGVGLETAKILFKLLESRQTREAAAERVRKIASSFGPSKSKPTDVSFANFQCNQCGLAKLFPVGSKFMCQNCNNVCDGFQDGDTI